MGAFDDLIPRGAFDDLIPPPPSTGQQALDVAKGIGAGAIKGVAAMTPAAMLSDPLTLGPQIGRYARDKLGMAPLPQTPFEKAAEYLPTSANLIKGMEPVTPQPQTSAGRMAESATPFAVGAAFPGGIARRALNVAVPYLGSEAGRAVGGEPGAVAGALLGPPGPAKTTRAIELANALKGSAQRGGYQAFDKAADSIIVSQPAFKGAVDDIEKELINLKFDKGLHPETAPLFERLKAESAGPSSTFKMQGLQSAGNVTGAPTNISLQGLEILRKNAAGIGAKAKLDADRNAANMIADKLDEFMENLKPGQYTGGGMSPAEAMAAKQTADAEWRRARKLQILDGIMERAKSSENKEAIKREFQALARSFEPGANRSPATAARAKRGWTADEIKAIREVADGTITRKALSALGQLSPQRLLGMLAIGGTGYYVDPQAAAILGGLGYGARAGANKISARGAQRTINLVGAGGAAPRRNRNAALARALLSARAATQGQ